MAKRDPAFLFYDGDAARDVSHMNRLERGCYFDLIQAQKKFGGFTLEQIRKIIGKDFDECWPALELVLINEDGTYYIQWVRDSIEDRKVFAEKNRKRIQDYWDKKKREEESNSIEEPEKYHGITNEVPYEDEDEIENEIEDLNNKKSVKKFIPPSLDEFKDYFEENGYSLEVAERAWKGYEVAGWKDSKGKQIKSWKQKCQHVWFKPENRNKGDTEPKSHVRRRHEENEQIKKFNEQFYADQ